MDFKRTSLVVGVLILAVLLSAWTQEQSVPDQVRSITVTGNAQVRVVPDEANLILGVETWNENLNTAKRENDARVKRILDLVGSYDIPSQHVKTDYINIHPGEHYFDRGDGFWVRKSIILTLRDLSKFEDLLTDALEAGATHVHEVRFQTTKLREHKDKARALAIRAAQEKAIDLASQLGQRVGKPVEIREDRSAWWYGSAAWWGGSWGGGISQNVVQEVAGGSIPEGESIAPGQITVDAQITVSFDLQR
jgi:uncharacterized protein YggE